MRLFYEDEFEALHDDIQAAEGYKSVASALWPDLKMETAYARLKACINPDKAEKLSPSEVKFIVKLARQHGSAAFMNYMCDECGFDRARFKEPENEKAKLQREFIDSVREQQRMLKRLELLDSQS